jgi:hypothetical protein
MNRKIDQNGFSILEYIVALIIVMVAIVAWLELAATGVKNTTFAKRLDDAETLASSRATELIKQADELVKKIPRGKRRVGSLSPDGRDRDYSDVLNESLELITSKDRPDENSSPKFVRQWVVIRDLPGKGEVTVLVSVSYKENNRTRLVGFARAVKSDGIKITKN